MGGVFYRIKQETKKPNELNKIKFAGFHFQMIGKFP